MKPASTRRGRTEATRVGSGAGVPAPDAGQPSFGDLELAIRACRICRDEPRYGKPLPHEPRPIIQVSQTVRIAIASQAPGIRVHKSGRPFDDPSGVRLRQWLDITEAEFYDASRVAIIPMGFCFPGHSQAGGDLPPRRECAETWHSRLFARLLSLELLVVIGGYAHKWHLRSDIRGRSVTEIVGMWRELRSSNTRLKLFPLPHPSWHNNRWLTQNPWFETDLLPDLRADVRSALRGSDGDG